MGIFEENFASNYEYPNIHSSENMIIVNARPEPVSGHDICTGNVSIIYLVNPRCISKSHQPENNLGFMDSGHRLQGYMRHLVLFVLLHIFPMHHSRSTHPFCALCSKVAGPSISVLSSWRSTRLIPKPDQGEDAEYPTLPLLISVSPHSFNLMLGLSVQAKVTIFHFKILTSKKWLRTFYLP